MDTTDGHERSPSEEKPTKGRGVPETRGRKGAPSEPPAPTKPAKDPERAKTLINSALRELRGGSQPGVARASVSLTEALELF